MIFTNLCSSEEVTVVLSGTSEIGQEVVKVISNEGKKALVIGRNQSKLRKLSLKYKCHIFQMDFNDCSNILELNQYLGMKSIKIKGFVIITPRPLFYDKALPTEESWHELFRLCYTRPLETLKASLPYFSRNAHIVILSGITSVQALPEYASYGVLRKMWLAESKSLAWELGSEGICVNTVSPGLVMTSHHLKKWQDEANLKKITLDVLLAEKAKNYPTNRLTTTTDVAKAINGFLNTNCNVTGQNLVVDGGLSPVY